MLKDSTKQILENYSNITKEIPLCSVKNCQYTNCGKQKTISGKLKVQEFNGLDFYWSELLKAQEASTSNYLYKIQIYGQNIDPTLMKKEPYPRELIEHRLRNISSLGCLNREEVFYILSFILNLQLLVPSQQREFLQLLQDHDLLDMEILLYMEILAKNPNAGLEKNKTKGFLDLIQTLIKRQSNVYNRFYNPQRLFMKPQGVPDPYELIYLKTIMETKAELTTQQYMYLLSVIERLKEMPFELRQHFLKTLYKKTVLPSYCFLDLLNYVKVKCKKINIRKLKNLMARLEILMETPLEVSAKISRD